MYQNITCKLKSSEKDLSRHLSSNLWYCHFCPKHLCMTSKSLQLAAKAVLMNRKKNIMVFNFTIFPSSLKTNTQLNFYAFLNHFSILAPFYFAGILWFCFIKPLVLLIGYSVSEAANRDIVRFSGLHFILQLPLGFGGCSVFALSEHWNIRLKSG